MKNCRCKVVVVTFIIIIIIAYLFELHYSLYHPNTFLLVSTTHGDTSVFDFTVCHSPGI